MDEDEFEECEGIHARPLTKRIVLGMGIAMISDLCVTFGRGLEAMAQLVVAADNYELERIAFHEQAARELEALMEEEE